MIPDVSGGRAAELTHQSRWRKSIESINLPQFWRRLVKSSCKRSKDYKCSSLFPQCCKVSNWLWFLSSGSNLIRPTKVNDRPFLDWLDVWHQYVVVVVVKNNYYLHERQSGQKPLTSGWAVTLQSGRSIKRSYWTWNHRRQRDASSASLRLFPGTPAPQISVI